ncbi:MAG: tryptophan synthase subunit beta [Planctomycetota bacterium]
MPPAAHDIRPQLGQFGAFGGRYVSELLWPALVELADAYQTLLPDAQFQARLAHELRSWAGRPTPLTEVPSFAAACGLRVFLKREDLLHGGAHKTNNVIGQALLAKAMGKTRLIAETGAGQHGVATAMAGARYGLDVDVYMGAVDAARQRQNVLRMELCGACVIRIDAGTGTLKDAINEALRDWAQSLETTHYLLGTACGPDPFPSLVRDLHRPIGDEARAQIVAATGTLPDAVAACVGGGSNAIGIFQSFLADRGVALFGVEPAGQGLHTGRHGATLARGRPGLLHGARTYVMQDPDGQIEASHSVAAGLDYPGVGPQHAALLESGRARYVSATDAEMLGAFARLSRCEGITPAFESAHALAFAQSAVARGALTRGATLLINLSGRGDKDLDSYLGLQADRGAP